MWLTIQQGAGSGGASAAHYIKRFNDPCIPVNITVYERSSYVGGRSTTVHAYDDLLEPAELGASIFVQVNRNLVNAVAEFNLSTEDDEITQPDSAPSVLGIWNGEEFVFTQDDDSYAWWNVIKIIWKYGFMNVARNQALMKKTVGKFLQMYDEPYFPFRSLSETAFELGLTEITATTGTQLLAENNIHPPYSTDIIQASTRVNYAQNLDQIHGLETMVCMAIQGQMSVKGGNWQIFQRMLNASGANLLLNTSVSEILLQDDNTYVIKAFSEPGSLLETPSIYHDTYDAVILAAPLQFSNISIVPVPPSLPSPIPYVTLYVTLLTSPHLLSPLAFNLPASAVTPNVILTTRSPNPSNPVPFFSISTLRKTRRGENLYKIFSPAPVTSTFLAKILGLSLADGEESIPQKDISWMYTKTWHSYPYLPPRITFDDPSLDEKGLWYTSGIEGFISTMETSSLMGMNVAKLVTNGWKEESKGATGAKATENVGKREDL